MSNTSPASVTVTSTTGPGVALTSKVFTDVVKFECDFVKNTIALTRMAANGTLYVDYSAMATLTWTISGGLTTVVVSS